MFFFVITAYRSSCCGAGVAVGSAVGSSVGSSVGSGVSSGVGAGGASGGGYAGAGSSADTFYNSIRIMINQNRIQEAERKLEEIPLVSRNQPKVFSDTRPSMEASRMVPIASTMDVNTIGTITSCRLRMKS